MRIFIRVIYALLIGFGLFLVFSLTDSYYRRLKIEELGEAELLQSNYAYFIGSKYYKETPILETTFTENHREYKIMFYEVASYGRKDGNVVAESGISIVIHQTAGDLLPDRLYAKIFGDNFIELNYTVIRFGNLPVFTIINAHSNIPVVEVKDFIVNDIFYNIKKLEISYILDGTPTLNYNFDIKETDFTIGDELLDYYNTNDKAPNLDFNNVKVKSEIIETFNLLVWLWVSLYIVVVIGLTIGLRFYRRYKNMGKKELTPGLEADVKRLSRRE